MRKSNVLKRMSGYRPIAKGDHNSQFRAGKKGRKRTVKYSPPSVLGPPRHSVTL